MKKLIAILTMSMIACFVEAEDLNKWCQEYKEFFQYMGGVCLFQMEGSTEEEMCRWIAEEYERLQEICKDVERNRAFLEAYFNTKKEDYMVFDYLKQEWGRGR